AQASVLTGSVILDRAVFSPRTDLWQLLLQASRPEPPALETNDYLRGMRLDVRVASASTFELETSLTRNIEADTDLRLRGTAARPVLQGNITINQGEAQIFGNKYTINRGDIRFFNPAKIEPHFDIDAETRARSHTVNVNFSGTLDKFQMNTSSDPPLTQQEIF